MKLKITLLSMILDNQPAPNKYTKAFLNLQNVFKLEIKEGFKVPVALDNQFNILQDRYNNFIVNIPLNVIERYYIDHKDNLNKFVYLEYKDNELTDLRVIELYAMLEDYFNDVFELACNMANYYNLEIKLSKDSDKERRYI